MRGGTRKVELGEGRSKSIYIEPVVTDTVVLLVFYNPAKFRRIYTNMAYIIKILKEKNIPYYLCECVFHGAKPQFPAANMILHSNSYMFYKEQLINKLETIIPLQYTKLLCIDGDIIFDSPDWFDQSSKLLDKVDIIQPFSEACWLTPDNTRIRSKKPSYAYAIVHKKLANPRVIHSYHPGFAWGFRRETFKALQGFYLRSIVGNGDMLFTFNFFRDELPITWTRDIMKSPSACIEGWKAYHENFKRVAPTIGYLSIKALHIFHGVRHNRQYTTRYKDMSHLLQGSWADLIHINSDGLFEFKDPKASAAVLEYFKRRNEDIPLEEALKILARPTRRVRNPMADPNGQIITNGQNLNGQPPINIPTV